MPWLRQDGQQVDHAGRSALGPYRHAIGGLVVGRYLSPDFPPTTSAVEYQLPRPWYHGSAYCRAAGQYHASTALTCRPCPVVPMRLQSRPSALGYPAEGVLNEGERASTDGEEGEM
jgi:hypothetical protein